MMHRILGVVVATLLVLGVAGDAYADEPESEGADPIDTTLTYEFTLRGRLSVDPDGRVAEASLEEPSDFDALDEQLVTHMRAWTFQPLDGVTPDTPAEFIARMWFTATPVDDTYTVTLDGARFVEANVGLRPARTRAPNFPQSALLRGISASVMVGFRVDQRGRVVDPHVMWVALWRNKIVDRLSDRSARSYAQGYARETLRGVRWWNMGEEDMASKIPFGEYRIDFSLLETPGAPPVSAMRRVDMGPAPWAQELALARLSYEAERNPTSLLKPLVEVTVRWEGQVLSLGRSRRHGQSMDSMYLREVNRMTDALRRQVW